jgi:hypothetical protein
LSEVCFAGHAFRKSQGPSSTLDPLFGVLQRCPLNCLPYLHCCQLLIACTLLHVHIGNLGGRCCTVAKKDKLACASTKCLSTGLADLPACTPVLSLPCSCTRTI